MKPLTRLASLIILLFVASLASADVIKFKTYQAPAPTISYESIYDFRDHATYAVATRSLGQLTHVLGTRLSLEAFGFVGADTTGAPVVGVGAKAKLPIADQLDVFAGPGVLFRQGKPFRIVAFVGLSFRFNQP